MSVGVVAVEAVGEHQHVAQAECLAESLHDLVYVLGRIAVLARQAIERRDSEAVTVDFDGSTFKDVGDAGHERIARLLGNRFGNLVVIGERREFRTPGVKHGFCDDRLVALLQEERTVVANPDVVVLDDRNLCRERPVAQIAFLVFGKELLAGDNHVYLLVFRNGAD